MCSTPNCSGSVPAASSGARCISCVKLDWKSVKDRLNTSKPHRERGSGNILPSALSKSTNAKPKKCVTWSDTVTIASENGKVIQRLACDIEEGARSSAFQNVDTMGDDVHISTKVPSTESRMVGQEALSAPPKELGTLAPGWDSELSDLTESNDSDSSDEVRFSFRQHVSFVY